MKKITAGFLALVLLTGCAGKDSMQTLFVSDSKDHYGLIDIDGEKQTKFIYDNYEAIGNDGYIVIKGKKYGYLDHDGKEVIKLGEYKKIESISKMLVAYDGKDNITILNSTGKELYKASKKVTITLSGLPIVYHDKKYTVLYDTGEELYSGKDEILSANTIKDNYSAICLAKNVIVFNHDDMKNPVTINYEGKTQLMAQSHDLGYLFYNRDSHEVVASDAEGKVTFKATIELDDLYFDSNDNITGVKDQKTYLFGDDGSATAINSYYRNLKNYVIKNQELIYGPHTFVYNGKETTVENIQLDPMASYTQKKIFPVYVRSVGYMYYGFDGKAAIDDKFVSATTFDQNNLAIVAKKEDKHYLMDLKGEKVSKEYVKLEYIGETYYAGYTTSSKYEVIDKSGKRVIKDYFMDTGTVFAYNDKHYGIFNKSGTSYVYDMENVEVIFSTEGELEFDESGYFVTLESGKYYTVEGKKIYKR